MVIFVCWLRVHMLNSALNRLMQSNALWRDVKRNQGKVAAKSKRRAPITSEGQDAQHTGEAASGW